MSEQIDDLTGAEVSVTKLTPEVQGDNPTSQMAKEVETVEISDVQLLKLLEKRVADAEQKINDGRQMMADGQKMHDDGQEELRAARRDKNKYFPPMTEAANIQDAIASSNAERAARVARQGGASRIDVIRKFSRGSYGRPTPQGVNQGHGLRGAFTRQEAARLGFRLPGSPASAGR